MTVSVEKLERRFLLAASLKGGGLLRIFGDASTTSIDLTQTAAAITLQLNGQRSVFDAARVKAIAVYGGPGADTINLHEDEPDAVTVPASIYGGGGDDS